MKSNNLILLVVAGVIAFFLFKAKGSSSGSTKGSPSATASFNPPASVPKVGGTTRSPNTGTIAGDIANYANVAATTVNLADKLYNKYFGSKGNEMANSSPYTSGGDQNFDFFAGSGKSQSESGGDQNFDFFAGAGSSGNDNVDVTDISAEA